MRSISSDSTKPLRDLIRRLRRQCPWDKKQTFASLRPLVLEEAYELSDALAGRNSAKIEEELGDLLFMVLFLAHIGEEEKKLRLSRLVRKTVAKLKRRHPHVFKGDKARTVREVLSSWERTKSSVFAGIPRALPALQKAQTIQERAKRVNFEFKDIAGPRAKVKEEIAELEAELDGGTKQKIEEEMGDLLFGLVNLTRYLKFDAENCLQRANGKFIRRFSAMENDMRKRGKAFGTATLEEMDESWEAVKARSSKRAKNRSPRRKVRS